MTMSASKHAALCIEDVYGMTPVRVRHAPAHTWRGGRIRIYLNSEDADYFNKQREVPSTIPHTGKKYYPGNADMKRLAKLLKEHPELAGHHVDVIWRPVGPNYSTTKEHIEVMYMGKLYG